MFRNSNNKKSNGFIKRSKLNRQLSFEEGVFQASIIPSNLPAKMPSVTPSVSNNPNPKIKLN